MRATGSSKATGVGGCGLIVVALLAVSSATPARADCIASVRNRSVPVDPVTGGFSIPNVPLRRNRFFGGILPIQVVVTCTDGGQTTQGASDWLIPTIGGVTLVGPISFPARPAPRSIATRPSLVTLAPGETSQVQVTGTFDDQGGGTHTEDLTSSSQHTSYTTSNPNIATVSGDGLVTAGATEGNAIIGAINQAVTSTMRISVVATTGDRDHDGMPDDWEIQHYLNPDDPSDAPLDGDADGLTNLQEYQRHTDPWNPDSDGDGLRDGDEVFTYGSDPANVNSDGDTGQDGEEVKLGCNPAFYQAATVVGRLLDASGLPVSGATARAHGRQAVSDANGRFTLTSVSACPQRTVDVLATAQQGTFTYRGNSGPYPLPLGGTVDVGDIVMRTPPALTPADFSNYPVPKPPGGIFVLADLNGDGRLDMVTATAYPAGVSMRLGNGDGTYQAPSTIVVDPFGALTTSIALADMNLDRRLDLVVGTREDYPYFDHGIVVLPGNGDGTFGAPGGRFLQYPWASPVVAAGDLDLDGAPDVVAMRNDDLYLYRGAGDGTLQQPINLTSNGGGFGNCTVTLAEFSGDQRPDIASSICPPSYLIYPFNGVAIYRNTGGGSGFDSSSVALAGIWPSRMTLADLDSDGNLDVVTGNANTSDVSVLVNSYGGLRFNSEVRMATGRTLVAAGDLTGDGLPDLVTYASTYVSNSKDLYLMAGVGDGTFGAERVLTKLDQLASASIADINADGVADLVVSGSRSLTFLGLGGGNFFMQERYSSGQKPMSVALGDVTGDGVLDVVSANKNTNDISIFSGRGDGTFNAEQRVPVGTGPIALSVGDLDGAYGNDIVTANSGSGNVSVLLRTAGGGFTQSTIAAGGAPAALALGHVDGNSTLDIVVAGSGVRVFLGTGNGTFGAAKLVDNYGYTTAVTLADVSHDGKTDLLLGYGASVQVLLGDGAGNFGSPRVLSVGCDPTTSIVVGDFNRDGVTDIAASSNSSSPFPNCFEEVSVLIGNADGSFQAERANGVGNDPGSLISTDVNGDGVADLATANSYSGDVSVLMGDGFGGFQLEQRFAASTAPTGLAVQDLDGDGFQEIVVAASGSNDVSVLRHGGGNCDPAAPGVTAVTGRVVDQSANPVPGATLTVRSQTATTDVAGRFTIQSVGLDCPRSAIVAEAEGSVNGRRAKGSSGAVAPLAGGTTDVGAIVVAPFCDRVNPDTSIATGRVVDSQQGAVAGAQVTVNGATRTTDGSGQFSISGVSVPCPLATVTASAVARINNRTYLGSSLPMFLNGGSTTDFGTIHLQAGCLPSIPDFTDADVQVTDGAGIGFPNAEVRLPGARNVTDGQGRASLPSVAVACPPVPLVAQAFAVSGGTALRGESTPTDPVVGGTTNFTISLQQAYTMYGGLGNGSPSNPGGIVTVNAAAGTQTLVGDPVTPGGLSGLAFDAAGTLYGATIYGGQGGPSKLVKLDPDSGTLIATIGPIVDSVTGQGMRIADLSFQPGTNILYGIRAYLDGSLKGRLYQINATTAVATEIGNTGPSGVGGIAFAPNGTLYQTRYSPDEIATLDPATGAVLTSRPMDGFADGIGVRPTDGALFVTVPTGQGNEIRRLDPDTGTTTLVGADPNLSPSDIDFRAEPAFVMIGAAGNGSPVSPGGLFDVDQVTGAATLISDPVTPGGLSGVALSASGKLYGSTVQGAGSTSDLVELDAVTGALVATVGQVRDSSGYLLQVADLAIQPGTDVLFATVYNHPQYNVYTIEKSTAIATPLATNLDGPTGIAFAPNGTLYASFYSSTPPNFSLGTLDPSNGATVSKVTNDVGFDGLGVRPSDGAVFGTVGGSGGQENNIVVYLIDPATGVSYRIDGGNPGRLSDLAFRPR